MKSMPRTRGRLVQWSALAWQSRTDMTLALSPFKPEESPEQVRATVD
jgi:hypothetical protein